jgi:2-polyprenyl-3-methyl-5-hydroxy-6-metoxy-1,4-benzoquinol methylase
MADDFKYDVFLSHSSKDKSIVRAVAERLREDGLRVWLDDWELHPGDSIPAKIEEGLEYSRVLVLCMSAHAFGSDWAQLEAGTFRFRDPLNKERRFIPLRLDVASIPGSLAQFLYINWLPRKREQGYGQLVKACRNPKAWPRPSTVHSIPSPGVACGQVIPYRPSKLSSGVEKQIILRCRAMERLALAWLLVDQLPSGGWGRSLVPWMKANWKSDPISPDPLMEEEGGFESSILSFHVFYHCCAQRARVLPRQVLARFKTYLDRHENPRTHGYGTRSVSRDGIELSVRLRHTALGTYGLLLLNQIERGTVTQRITQTLQYLLRQENHRYTDDRNGCLLYALMDFLVAKITLGTDGPFDAYVPPRKIIRAIEQWRRNHEPTMRGEFLRSIYSPFGTNVQVNCDPYLVPYGGFSRMTAYTFLTVCQFAHEQPHREVTERLCAGLLALMSDYEESRSAGGLEGSSDPLKPRIHGVRPWPNAESPDLGTTALLLAALSNSILRDHLKRHAGVGRQRIRDVCGNLLQDLTNLFDRYLVDPELFEYTHATAFAFLLLATDSGLSRREMEETAAKVAELRFDCGLSERTLNDFVEDKIFAKESDLPAHIFAASVSRLLLDKARPGRYPEGRLDFTNDSNKGCIDAVVGETLRVYDNPVFVEAFCSVWAPRPMTNVVSAFTSVLAQRGRKTVLDVGSGPGQNARLLCNAGMHVTLLDASSPMLDRAKQELKTSPAVSEFKQLDVRSLLTLGERRFDGIWCSGTIHFPEPLAREIIRSFSRLLTENGVLMVNCAIDNPRLVAKDGRFFAYWRDQEHFSRLLTAADFEIVEVISSFLRPNTYRESSVRIRWDNFICSLQKAETDVGRIGQLTSTAYDLIVRRFVAQHKQTFNEKLVEFVAKELRKRGSGGCILDAGCGPGHYSGVFAKKGFQVTGIDLSRVMIEEAKENYPDCTFGIQDLSDLRFEEGLFDCVFCMAAFQHIPVENGTARKTLEGFRRVLKTGGLIMLDVQLGRETGFEPDGRFTQGYRNEEEAAKLLLECGFRVLWKQPWVLEPKKNTFQRNIELRFCDFLGEKL